MLNSILLASAEKIINSNTPTQFTLVAHFLSAAEGSTFSFYPIFIDGMTIIRDYSTKYTDIINLGMTISPKDYALLQDQGQDLRCVVTITYVDRYGRQVFNPTPIQTQYNVIINDPIDVRMTVPDAHLYTEPSMAMSVRLMEKTVYALRHTKINTVYQTMTVTQAIHAITHGLGIEYLHLVPSDNKHVYDHIEIGSYQGIDSIYGYLQHLCGVYHKGINAYFTNNTLFIYPPFETNPDYDKTTMFYQVDTGRYAGSHIFHKVDKGDVSIVINTQPKSTDLSIVSSENIGTGIIFNRASRMSDGVTTVDSNTGAQFTSEQAMSISLANPRTAVGGNHNMRHIHGTDNPFPAMSELIAHQASLMDVTWDKADPFLMDPCQKIVYYYDRNETMMKRTGILEKAMYQITRKQRMDVKSMFECVGQLQLRLAPNETMVL